MACGALATDNHHVLYTQRWPELGDEPDNLIALCRSCHANHHSGMRRLSRSLCRYAEKLADDGPKQAFLKRTYGRSLASSEPAVERNKPSEETLNTQPARDTIHDEPT